MFVIVSILLGPELVDIKIRGVHVHQPLVSCFMKHKTLAGVVVIIEIHAKETSEFPCLTAPVASFFFVFLSTQKSATWVLWLKTFVSRVGPKRPIVDSTHSFGLLGHVSEFPGARTHHGTQI